MQLAILPASGGNKKKVFGGERRSSKEIEKQKRFNSAALDRYKISKLDGIKFKMELQTKNLKVLTGYDEMDKDGKPPRKA